MRFISQMTYAVQEYVSYVYSLYTITLMVYIFRNMHAVDEIIHGTNRADQEDIRSLLEL